MPAPTCWHAGNSRISRLPRDLVLTNKDTRKVNFDTWYIIISFVFPRISRLSGETTYLRSWSLPFFRFAGSRQDSRRFWGVFSSNSAAIFPDISTRAYLKALVGFW